MGPTIILDKSALQSLSGRSVFELSRYFYTNITPVLLMEILADLQLDATDINECRKIVSEVARKVIPVDAITNTSYRLLCVSDLLGSKVKMDRRPIVVGGQPVTSADGQRGFYLGVQPENQAVLRWRRGNFSEADLTVAMSWRNAIEASDLETMKQRLPKSSYRLRTLHELGAFVDELLDRQESQQFLLAWFMTLLRLQAYLREWVQSRWNNNCFTSVKSFAPYACHCLRINMLFYLGMSNGLLSTRKSNVADIEYLYYSPFCQIFSTGDKFLSQMAVLVLDDDQSFVSRDELRDSLAGLAERRAVSRASDLDMPRTSLAIEPDENSLVQRLWRKHLGRFVPQADRKRISPERSEAILKEIQPILDAMRQAEKRQPPLHRWPR